MFLRLELTRGHWWPGKGSEFVPCCWGSPCPAAGPSSSHVRQGLRSKERIVGLLPASVSPSARLLRTKLAKVGRLNLRLLQHGSLLSVLCHLSANRSGRRVFDEGR